MQHLESMTKSYSNDIAVTLYVKEYQVKEANVKIANFNVSQLCPKNVFTLKLPKPCYMYYV